MDKFIPTQPIMIKKKSGDPRFSPPPSFSPPLSEWYNSDDELNTAFSNTPPECDKLFNELSQPSKEPPKDNLSQKQVPKWNTGQALMNKEWKRKIIIDNTVKKLRNKINSKVRFNDEVQVIHEEETPKKGNFIKII